MFRFFKRKASPPVVADETVAPQGASDLLADGAAGMPHEASAAIDHAALAAQAPIAAPPVEPLEPTVEVTPQAAWVASVEPPRASWLNRLRAGLRKTGASIAAVFTDAQIDDELYEELEAALLMADAGVPATAFILDDLRRRVKTSGFTNRASVKQLLVECLMDLLLPLEGSIDVGAHTPTVIMVAGVNGAGKTTSIGKLTRHLAQAQCKVLLAAADTFRAAAKEQLAVWADRTHVQIVSQEGGDPAAVAFDAVKAGTARGCDVVIVDTAGRLTTQTHLMDELRKIKRTLAKAQDGAPHEVLLVVDGNTGQNALSQAKSFDDAIDVTGLIVTKLDGTAKGGVLAALALWAQDRAKAKPDAQPLRVYFIGVGETLADLERFNSFEYAGALLE
jgi:fused signal recognition particle receptor